MTQRPLNQNGFIPLLLSVLAVVIALIYIVYARVLHAQN